AVGGGTQGGRGGVAGGGVRGLSSWPGIAARRTASLPLAHPPALHHSFGVREHQDVDSRHKAGHDDSCCRAWPPPSRSAKRTLTRTDSKDTADEHSSRQYAVRGGHARKAP